VKGFLEFVSPVEVRGWVWDPTQVNVHCQVQIELNGRVLTTVPATQFRIDLRDHGVGNGDHAFVAYLADAVQPSECSKVEAFVCQDDGSIFRADAPFGRLT
jgi:hypothetical protein